MLVSLECEGQFYGLYGEREAAVFSSWRARRMHRER